MRLCHVVVAVVACSACGKVQKEQADAAIDAPTSFPLALTIAGAGHVTSSPAGIDCTDSCSHDFDPGAMVTLSAVPASGGSFDGWSGDCAGTICEVTLDAAKSVTATFECSGTQTFTFVGGPQTFNHAACVTSITVDVQGAGGGLGIFMGNPIGTRTLGGRVQATIPIQPSDVITVFVGGAGGDAIATAGGTAGYNGGATGAAFTDSQRGGGGGGASDIRINGMTIAERVVVAGGGGGVAACSGAPITGGAGGGLTGANGGTCNGTGEIIATGGTQTAGGTGGMYSGYCTGGVGVLGGGGIGCSPTGGGGAGGGYYGGGGGSWNGGAGGSSFTSTAATNVTHTQGFTTGNGQVIITY